MTIFKKGIKMMMDVATSRRIFSKTGLKEILDGVWGSILSLRYGNGVKKYFTTGEGFGVVSRYLGAKKAPGLGNFIKNVKRLWNKGDVLKKELDDVYERVARTCKP